MWSLEFGCASVSGTDSAAERTLIVPLKAGAKRCVPGVSSIVGLGLKLRLELGLASVSGTDSAASRTLVGLGLKLSLKLGLCCVAARVAAAAATAASAHATADAAALRPLKSASVATSCRNLGGRGPCKCRRR